MAYCGALHGILHEVHETEGRITFAGLPRNSITTETQGDLVHMPISITMFGWWRTCGRKVPHSLNVPANPHATT